MANGPVNLEERTSGCWAIHITRGFFALHCLVLLSLLMVSCQSKNPYSQVSKPDPPKKTFTHVPTTTSPFKSTKIPTTQTQAPLTGITVTPTKLAVSEPSPTGEEVFKVCSPLAWETLGELQEIVSDPYAPPPPNQLEARHHGVDFSHYQRKVYSSIAGEPILAMLSGKVAGLVIDRLPYGNMVIIETADSAVPSELKALIDLQPGMSLYLLYAHMENPPAVEIGMETECGQPIGEVGATGYNIVNPHLHLEARIGPAGFTFIGMAFYTTSASESEMENYKLWRIDGGFSHFDPFIFINYYLEQTQE